MSRSKRKRNIFSRIIQFFRNKNRRIAICAAVLWLGIVLGADALIIHAVHTKFLSYGMVSWWSILRLILVVWTVMIYKFVRSFDKTTKKKSKDATDSGTDESKEM